LPASQRVVSLASVPLGYLLRLVLEDGAEADPPPFTNGHWNWAPGDEIMVGAEPKYRIVDVIYEDDSDVQGVFVVAPL
jgi:hypothetical protein